MYRITTANGRVGHIAGSIVDKNDGREITTSCGKTYPEYDLRVDDDLDPCAACDKKFFNLVDKATDEYATLEEAADASEKLEVKEPVKATEAKTTSKDK